MTDTTKQKIKIFISYGHKDSQIFKKVVAYLREKGYEVWFDKSSISGTDDWRQEIVEGIRDSQTVIAGLSHDFLKEGGVCSEEMGIALAVKSNRIFTIYLDEKEDLKKIPPTLTRSQYINLSDWKEYIDDDQAFDKWFKKEFQPIIDRIESKDNKEFSGQINTIRSALKIPEIGSNRVNSYLMKKYTKRPWIDEKLEKWRDDSHGEKLGVIIGKQGTGKSHYAARRCHTDYRIAANFFCEYNKENFSTSKSLIRDLAFQLACQIPDFRTALLNQLESIAITKKKINQLGFEELVDDGKIHIREDYTEEDEFDILIVRPFSICIDGKMETHLILIDALDEAGKEERSRLIDILVNHLDRLPRWIKILILTRPEADIKPYLEDAFEIDLDQENNNKDIRAFLETSFEKESHPNKREIIEAIVEKSQGTFLYAELVTKEILAGSLSIEDIDKLPKGLARYFSSWFKRIYPIEKIDETYKEKDRKAIAMILASPGPLPKEELNNLLGWEYSQINDFVKKLENYLTINEDVEGKETIEIAHKYMVDWLLSDLAGDYRVFKEDGLSYIYKGIEEIYMLDKDLETMTRYEKLNLIDAFKGQRGQKALKDFLGNGDAKDKLIVLSHEEEESFRIDTSLKLLKDMTSLYKENNALVFYLLSSILYSKFLGELRRDKEAINILKEAISFSKLVNIKEDKCNFIMSLGLVYINLGDLYSSLKMYKESENSYKESINILEELKEISDSIAEREGIILSFNGLGLLYYSTERYEEAEKFYKKSINILEELKFMRHSLNDMTNLVNSYNNIGNLYVFKKKYKEAEKYLKESADLQEEICSFRNSPDDKVRLARSNNNLGFLYGSMKNYELAEIYYKKAIVLMEDLIRERNSINDKSDLANYYMYLGYICEVRKKYKDSENLYKKSIQILETLAKNTNFIKDMEDLATAYTNLGYLYKAIGRYDDSELLWEKASKIFKELKEK